LALLRTQREHVCATRIQLAYRRHLLKMYGQALCDMFTANKYLMYVAGLKITSMARGRLGRRIAKTERALLVIKKCHPLLIRHALRSVLRGPQVFWYKRQLEVDMLYANYIDFVRKTGFQPHRKRVEDNVQEIARRIIARQNILIVLVQRRWRGYMARRIVRYFRTEISRLFQFRVARVMKIQRVYRGHAARLGIPVLIRHWERERVMADYLTTSKDDDIEARRQKAASQVMGFYSVERNEEKTCRYTSRIAGPEHYGMKKMIAFADSPYADERLNQQTSKLMSIEYIYIKRERDARDKEHNRKIFMENRIAEVGPLGFGFRSVPMINPPCDYYYDAKVTEHDLGLDVQSSTGININYSMLTNVATGTQTLSHITSSRSRSFRIYFSGELKQIAAAIVERMQHEFSHPGLGNRFKDFNNVRLGRLKRIRQIEHKMEAERQRLVERAAKDKLRQQAQELKASTAAASSGGGGGGGVGPAAVGKRLSRSKLAAEGVSFHALSSSSGGGGGGEGLYDEEHLAAALDTQLDQQQQAHQMQEGRKMSNSSTGSGVLPAIRKTSTSSMLSRSESANIGNNRRESSGLSVTFAQGKKSAGNAEEELEENAVAPKAKNKNLQQQKGKFNVDKLRGNFKYPEHIYFNAMEWLYQDYDV
jgi:hypothetical protein